MKYKKIVSNGYISAVGKFWNGEVITEEEYNIISSAFVERPEAPEGYRYKLCAGNLEWELVELPPAPQDLSADELLSILLGGAT